MPTLILLRHGQSEWNLKNLFTGWVDVDLTEKGEAEAVRGGELLLEAEVLPTVLHTSLLTRALAGHVDERTPGAAAAAARAFRHDPAPFCPYVF